MISEGADIDINTGLMFAMMKVMGYNTEFVRILLDSKNIEIDRRDSYGWTALHHACAYKHVKCKRCAAIP